MKIRCKLAALCVLWVAALALVGCGGGGSAAGGGDTTGSAADRGVLSLQIQWPAPPTKAVAALKAGAQAQAKSSTAKKGRAAGGAIPTGTKAVKIVVISQTTNETLDSQTVTAPAGSDVSNLVTVVFKDVPAGQVQVTATAYPDAAAQQTPIATGSATGEVKVRKTQSVTIPMTLTISGVSVTPASVTLKGPFSGQPAGSAPVVAKAVNASNQTLTVPLDWFAFGDCTVTVDPTDATKATITAGADSLGGTGKVVVVEPNSGLSATVDVKITPGGGGG